MVFFVGFMLCLGSRAEQQNDTVSTFKRASFVEVGGSRGTAFNTNEFVRDIPHYNAFSLRYGRASNGSSWEDIAYNMPYWGIGLYAPFFANDPGLGNPFSLHMFKGRTLAQFTDKLGLTLEMRLGLSMRWDYFDPNENPYNIAISLPSNAHVGLGVYLEYFLSPHFDLKFGVDLNHFSNGSRRKPNGGVNKGGVGFSLAYHINPPNKGFLLRNSPLEPPEIPRRIDHNLQVIFSSRQLAFSMEGTNLPLPYVNRRFSVLGLVYSPVFVPGNKAS